MACELGVVHGASGSARLRDGDCAVLCAVHGPRASQSQKNSLDGLQFNAEVKFAQYVDVPLFSTHLQPFGRGDTSSSSSSSSSAGQGDIGSTHAASAYASASASAVSAQSRTSVEKLLSDLLREALVGLVRTAVLPKMSVTVCVSVLQSSGNLGSDLACAINGCSLALADASVEMHDLAVASTVGCYWRAEAGAGAGAAGEAVISAPTRAGNGSGSGGAAAAAAASSYLTVASRCNAPEMTQLWSEGRAQLALVFRMVQAAAAANAAKKLQVQAFLLEKLRAQLGYEREEEEGEGC